MGERQPALALVVKDCRQAIVAFPALPEGNYTARFRFALPERRNALAERFAPSVEAPMVDCQPHDFAPAPKRLTGTRPSTLRQRRRGTILMRKAQRESSNDGSLLGLPRAPFSKGIDFGPVLIAADETRVESNT